ncbi:MAG: FHA domain-containing protein [Desulfosarcina sp.]|nr:FHA domain-containing protein [Desulfosarcina sp.]MBC2766199.1 FHA domain-containing protein [Desulfosarcina sp.]
MIIYCEECGFKNTLDEERIKGQRPQIPCKKCGEFLRFYGLKAKALKAPPPKLKKAQRSCLILKYGKVVVIVNEANARVEIGRQKSNDIQVVNNRVSRTHALIEHKNGKYYLTDLSSNGTYLLMEGRKGITVRKKEVLLTAKGVIGPGYKVDFKSPDAVHLLFEQTP